MADLHDKIVLVTGGSGGLGQALAEAFAIKQSRVVLTARNAAKLEAAADKVAHQGAQVLALPADITRRDHVQRLGKKISAHWGDVQILINNAGIARAVGFAEVVRQRAGAVGGANGAGRRAEHL